MSPRLFARLAAYGCLALGLVVVLKALFIPAKAVLAQALLEQAWARTRDGETAIRPWPWADIAAVAEIRVPKIGARAIVLDSASGQAMAFGPGHMPETPAIGAPGTAVVAAHRDTHFRFLRSLKAGDLIEARTPAHPALAFRVVATGIVRADASGIDPADGGRTGARLALVTCYPFDGLRRSTWRYVVLAEAEDKTEPSG